MLPHDIALLTLREWGGHVEGKTKLHKIIYFVSLLSGTETDLGFDAHYYGPYSSPLDDALYDLTSSGLLDRRVLRTGHVNNSGFEVVRYDYSLTDGGREVADHKIRELGSDGEKVIEALKTLKSAGVEDYMRLAAAAKIRYIVQQSGKPISREEVQQMAEGFGWRLSENAINDAVNYLIRLNLVKLEE